MPNSKYVPYYKTAGTKTTKEWYELFIGKVGEVAIVHKLEYQTFKKGKVHSTSEAVVRVRWIENIEYVHRRLFNMSNTLCLIDYVNICPDRNGITHKHLPDINGVVKIISSLLNDKDSLINSMRFGGINIVLKQQRDAEYHTINLAISY